VQATIKRTTVCIDTRRTVNMLASARKPQDVAKEGHEQFIRNLLKDKMGWPRREPAPESIKAAAREMAARLVQRDKDLAEAKRKAKEEQAAREAAANAEQNKLRAATEASAAAEASNQGELS
jgi:hypothetical protein